VFSQLNVTGYYFEDINLSGIITSADANVVFGNLNRTSQVPSSVVDSALTNAQQHQVLIK
jgi:hypothetical protein